MRKKAVKNQLGITTKHTGKMHGMQSLSTAVSCNGRCAENAKVKGSICEKCYASTMCKMYSNLDAMLTNNYNILTGSILDMDDLPVLNCSFFRFEAFGDLESVSNGGVLQCINYFNICKKNPFTNFAIWTKNPDTIATTIKLGFEKPSNLNIGVSSLMINKTRDVSAFGFVDFVFTVYTLDYLLGNGYTYDFINCGARSCMGCLKCYKPINDGVVYINELLKQDVKRAEKIGFITK